ncbi:MAG: sugar phosphate isomerase/epimerase [Candidatus Latescibacteria bacterium]|jgi:sugar phosphate isomerase/epimerase|nr:sugar phosphate isomerase/epimerase [Candidatus Latescibacterota bacterium]
MDIGIFTSTFGRSTLGETLDAVGSHDIKNVQFDLPSAGLTDMPDALGDDQCATISAGMLERGITMSGLSGTFNIIHPDLDRRNRDMASLGVLSAACRKLGTQIVTVCTGTCDPDHMWRRHPDNDSPEAWAAMIASMEIAVGIAEEHDVTLAFEPEVNNVVDSAAKARRLLDEISSKHLKVVIDGANLFHKGELPRMREILDHAFQILGSDIVMAHAKDLSKDGDAGHEAAGTGLLDYGHYIHLFREMDFQGALVLHSLEEHQVPSCLAFLRDKL